MKRYIFIFFLLLFQIKFCAGQNPFITNYSITEGLPTSKIYCVIKDSKGFLWFGSDAGVFRYDGHKFKIYTEKDGLSDNMVVRIKEDLSGRIWFMNLNGSVNYFEQNRIFNSQTEPFLYEIKTNYLFHDFYQAADSTIYFYNSNADVYAIKNNRFIDYFNLRSTMSPVTSLFINQAGNSNFYVWTPSGNYELQDLNTLITRHRIPRPNVRIFPKNEREVFTIDDEGYLSLYVDFELAKSRIINVGSTSVNYVLEDNKGYIWISAFDKGIFCFRGSELVFHLPVNSPQNLILDGEDNIWTVSNWEGIFKINRDILNFRFIEKEKFEGAGIKEISGTNDGEIWGTNGSSVFHLHNGEIYTSDKIFKGENISRLYCLPDQTILAHGIETSLFTLKNPTLVKESHKIRFQQITASTDFQLKRSVIDSAGEFLYSFNNDNIIESNLKGGTTQYMNLASGRINNIFLNNQQQLVISAASSILVVDPRTRRSVPADLYSRFEGRFITSHLIIDKDYELFNLIGNELYLQHANNFYDILKDQRSQVDFRIRDMVYMDNTLFFYTVNTVYFMTGIMKIPSGERPEINRLNVEFHNINDIYGFDGQLYIGSDDGLTIIPASECINTDPHPTKPYIASVSIDDKETDISSGMVRYRNKNRLSIEFSSLNFSSIPSNYAYMLEGVNEDWITGNETQVVYLNLDPGKFTFKLKSRKNTEEYSEIIELPVIVVPEWYQRMISKILFIVLLVLIGFVILRTYFRQEIKAREKDYQLVTLENRALQSMMNPHFIFNSLGSIQKYLLENKAEEAGNYLSRFARLIRQTMNSIKSNSVLLDDEVDRLRNYIELEQLRMDHRFEYTIELDEKLEQDEYSIPSMIIQPFVENAIWHGISALEKMGKIEIRFKYIDAHSLRILIEDNGIGFVKARAFSQKKNNLNMASALTRKRLKLLGEKYRVDAGITETELYPGEENPGARIALILPIVD